MRLKVPEPHSRKETVLAMGIFISIMIPIRVISKEVFADGWIGSLGMLTVVITLIIVLSHKDKLGWYGPMFIRQITKMHKGKRRYFIFAQSSFLIIMAIFTIYAIEVGNSEYPELKAMVLAELRADGINIGEDGAMDSAMNKMGEISIEDQVGAIISIPVIAVKEFKIIAVTMAISNDLMDGWLLYIWQIVVIESIEFMGVYLVTKKYVKTKESTKKA